MTRYFFLVVVMSTRMKPAPPYMPLLTCSSFAKSSS